MNLMYSRLPPLLVALAAISTVGLHGCGENEATRSQPRPMPAAHPSGASPADLELLRWLQTTGEQLRADDACFRLSQCTNFDAPGELYSPSHPSGARACISERRAACQRRVSAMSNTQIPMPFENAFAQLRGDAERSLCYADHAAQLLDEHPQVVARLRLANRNVAPAMREHIRGWESLEGWAADHGRTRWASAFRDDIDACMTTATTAWPEAAAWLRARFSCGMLGCCTVERVAELRRRGLAPGPPDAACH